MSSPTSTKLSPPLYIDPRIRRRHSWWYVIIVIIDLVPFSIIMYFYFYPRFAQLFSLSLPTSPFSLENILAHELPFWTFALFAPLVIGIAYYLTIIWTTIITKIGLKLLNWLHSPQEGVFFRKLEDLDYKFWNLRNLMRIFLYWLLYTPPFTWGKLLFGFKWLDGKIGSPVQVHHAWISPEFVEIGNNVTIGQAAGVYSFQFEGNKLLVAKVIIKDNVIIGPQTVILPGTTIESNITINSGGFCFPFTKLSKSGYYSGQPTHYISEDPWNDPQLKK